MTEPDEQGDAEPVDIGQHAEPVVERTGRVPWARRWGYSGYPLVLVLIIVSYAFTAAQPASDPSEIALLMQLVTVGAVLYVARAPRRVQQVADVILGVAFIAVLVVLITGLTGDVLSLILAVGAMVAYFFAPLVIVVSETRRRSIDGETLFAAICAYLLIGMFFTFLYNIFALSEGSIFGPGHPDSLPQLLFFSFTTVTTTGYGNLVPVGAGVQSVAIAEAITGQLFLVTAIARVVTGWTGRRREPTR